MGVFAFVGVFLQMVFERELRQMVALVVALLALYMGAVFLLTHHHHLDVASSQPGVFEQWIRLWIRG